MMIGLFRYFDWWLNTKSEPQIKTKVKQEKQNSRHTFCLLLFYRKRLASGLPVSNVKKEFEN